MKKLIIVLAILSLFASNLMAQPYYRISRRDYKSENVLGVFANWGLAYWGYSAGKKAKKNSSRDFCYFSSACFFLRGIKVCFE